MVDNGNSILFRKFYLTIDSAKNLPDVRKYGETSAYAQVLIGKPDGKTTKSETKVDEHNGLNPVWNHPMEFQISEEGVLYYGLSLIIKLYAKRNFMIGGDRLIGEVHTTIKDLYDKAFKDGGSGSAKRSLPIKNGTEETDAMLNFCYSFSEKSFTVERNKFMEKAIQIAIDTMASAVGFDRESSTEEKNEVTEKKNELTDGVMRIAVEATVAAIPTVVPIIIAVVIAL